MNYMNDNKELRNNKVSKNNIGSANKAFKLDPKKVGVFLVAILLLVVVVFSIVVSISNKSEEPDHHFEKKAGEFYLTKKDGEDYYVSDAVEKAMVAVKWEHDLGTGIVTISGKDRKTKDKIVMTLKVEGYASFESMTRNGKEQNYNQWYEYLMSY